MRNIVSPLSGIRSPFRFIRGGGVVPFSPSTLFASGEEGAWYEPSPTTCFTDTAGTIPATVGDAVARINDLSGNGNHAIQVTAAARPLLQQTAGGLYYLAFDGSDDFFVIFGSQAWYDQYIGSIVIAASTDSTSSQDVVSNRGVDSAEVRGKYALSIRNNGVNWIYDNLVAGSGAAISTASPINTPYVFYGSGDGTNVSSSINSGSVTTVADTFTARNLDAYIGQKGGSATYFSGRIYGIVLTNDVLTAQEISDTETYLAAKSGVTL